MNTIQIKEILLNLNFDQHINLLVWSYNNNLLKLPTSFYFLNNFCDILETLGLVKNNFVENYFSNYVNHEYYLKQIEDIYVELNDLDFLKNSFLT
jgi:hypothetical protein